MRSHSGFADNLSLMLAVEREIFIIFAVKPHDTDYRVPCFAGRFV